MGNKSPANYIYSPSIFTESGIARTASTLARAFISYYTALRRDMFKWTDSSGLCDNMFLMSHYQCPEQHLVEHGQISFFQIDKDVHALPLSYEFKELNVYGFLDEWRVISCNPRINEMLRRMPLNINNAVLCQDSSTYTNDNEFIIDTVGIMVDIILSMRQRAIWNRQPIIFNEDNSGKEGEVGTFWKAFIECRPFVVKHKDALDFKVFDIKSNVDIGITDYFNFFETKILTHIGYDATDVHKRAQQSVPETLISQDKIMAKRLEKLRLRQQAAERCNKLFGSDIEVTSVLDSYPTQNILPVSEAFKDDINELINKGNSYE